MASTLQNVRVFQPTPFIPVLAHSSVDEFRNIYEQNRHRVYALAFWMSNNELQAEELLEATFTRAFAEYGAPTQDQIDRALLAELREDHLIGMLTLQCEDAREVKNVRSNLRRVHLELAVVELPATEKLIFLMHDVEAYSHSRIARLLGISPIDSQSGLHQARLRIRELVANMAW